MIHKARLHKCLSVSQHHHLTPPSPTLNAPPPPPPPLYWLSIAHFPFLPLFSKSPSTFACELLVYLLLYDAPTTLAFEKERGGKLPQQHQPSFHATLASPPTSNRQTGTHTHQHPTKKTRCYSNSLPGIGIAAVSLRKQGNSAGFMIWRQVLLCSPETSPVSVHVTGAIILLEFLLSTFIDIFNYRHARAR